MKRLLVILILIAINGELSAQAPTWQWVKTIGGGNFDEGYGITTDFNGNVIMTGKFESPSLILGTDTLNNQGFSGDILIAKFDASGNSLWAKSAGGSSWEEGWDVATDLNGNIYVIGTFWSNTIQFDSITLTNALNEDLFIVKFDSSGNVLWAQSAGGLGSDHGYHIKTDLSGNVFIAGNFDSDSLTLGSFTLANSGGQKLYLAKLDSSGNFLWAKTANGTSYSGGLATDASGNIILAGAFSIYITFDFTNLYSAGSFDIFIVKYNSTGTLVWAKSAGGTDYDSGGLLSVDQNGNAILTGRYDSPTITFGTTSLSNAGFNDMFVTKYDVSGNVIWARTAGGIGNDYGRGITTDLSGNVFVTGGFDPPSITFGSNTLNNLGGTDIFFVKYDSGGNVIWAQSAGGTGNAEMGCSMASDLNGNVFAIGRFASSPAYFNSTAYNSAGGLDIFMLKLGPGNVGFDEISDANDFKFFPNPVDNLLYVNSNDLKPGSFYIITNIVGSVVMTGYLNNSNSEIQLNELPQGMYLLNVPGTEINFKFVKE